MLSLMDRRSIVMMIFMLVQKCHLLYIHLHSSELRKLPLQNIFLMVKLFLSYCSIKCCISKKKLNFIEFFFSYWYLTIVRSIEIFRIKQMQIQDLLKVGVIFQCYFSKRNSCQIPFFEASLKFSLFRGNCKVRNITHGYYGIFY